MLTPSFVESDRSGVREIERARSRSHRESQPVSNFGRRQHFFRQTAGFRSKKENITRLVGDIGIPARRRRAERVDVRWQQSFPRGSQSGMHMHIRQIVIIQTGALEMFGLESKTKRLYQMELAAGIGR